MAGESSLSVDTTVITTHERMLARLDELEASVAQLLPLLPSTPGIGHNNPPPLDRAELDEIKADIARLKAQPQPPPVEANNIANKFIRFGERVLTWFGKQLDTGIEAFIKSAAKTAGITLGSFPLWLPFGRQLTDAAAAIMQWLMTLLGL